MDFWLEIQETFVLLSGAFLYPGLAIGVGLVIVFAMAEMLTAEVE